MGLKITKCKATLNTIKIYFSEAVINANEHMNYDIHSPRGTPITLTDASIQYFDAEKAALIILHTPPLPPIPAVFLLLLQLVVRLFSSSSRLRIEVIS